MRAKHLKSGSLSNGFILPSSKKDGISVSYCTIVIVFASSLNASQLLEFAKMRSGHTVHES